MTADLFTTHLFERLRRRLVEDDFRSPGIGIDLGTTKSCIAAARLVGNEIVCEALGLHELGQPKGEIAMPSVVAIRDGKPLVGHAARRLARLPKYLQHLGSFSEAKNEMGLRCTYSSAPEGYRTATEIAAHVLNHLAHASELNSLYEPAHCAMTVPASFHGAQRTATIAAASSFDWQEDGNLSLLDEPYAAMLDLMFRRPELSSELTGSGSCLLFDFGGGTCDVALFDMEVSDSVLAPRLRATSRYHRIGGGDIDRAIVYDHLLPVLLARYDIKRSDVSFADKRRLFEPALLYVAEQLKLALCRRLRVMQEEGRSDPALEVVAAGDTCIEWNGQELWCSDPTLNLEQFERLLKPFLNSEPHAAPSDEYVERQSIFSPILQTLTRAGVAPAEVSLVVLAGSSSLIPQVREALDRYFTFAQLEELGELADMQAGVARGAALQALSLAATGQPLIAPVSSSDIALRTRQGLLPLMKAGDALPNRSVESIRLFAPESRQDLPVDISIEVLADGGARVVGKSVWQLDAPVKAGEPLSLSWELDANQCLALSIRRDAQADAEVFEQRFDAPLTHIDQHQIARCRMYELSEAVRTGTVPNAALSETFAQMARDAKAIGQTERALHFIACAIQNGKPTRYLLNLRAIYLEELGDFERAEIVYREASAWTSARFNLALFLHRRGRSEEALGEIDRVLEEEPTPGHLVLKGDILAALKQTEASRLYYQEAVGKVDVPDRCGEWELGWLTRAARQLGQTALADRYAAQRQATVEAEHDSMLEGALLPDGPMMQARGSKAA